MKTLSRLLALCAIFLASYDTNAQVTTSSRPYLFNNFSPNIPTAVAELDKVFLGAEGSQLQFGFKGNFSFTGTFFLPLRDIIISIV